MTDQTVLAELDQLRTENAALWQENAELADACAALQAELDRTREHA